jgi:predicted membrane-bound spermidine synthase
VQELRPQFIRRILFFLFFVSGFCGLLYQVIWTRIAFAAFGIITPVLSVVLSVFMLGLALGSAAGGKWIPVLTRKTGVSAAFFYALAEFLIGVGAFAVPKLFDLGGGILLSSGEMNSFGYLSLSALVLAISILPWCFFMGTTFPFMMAYIREREADDAQSFSFLYVANVLGAMSGTILTALVFVEVLGFHGSLHVAAEGNFLIALISMGLGLNQKTRSENREKAPTAAHEARPVSRPRVPFIRWILFSTGFCAMAIEVVWTRAFTPVLKTQVYSFALIVFTYLGATFVGSSLYRLHLKREKAWSVASLMAILAVVVFVPIVVNNPSIIKMSWSMPMDGWSAVILLAGICPFCAVLGYLTPGLVDDYSGGDPTRAGSAYAINVCGCILGPLFASYVLLPWTGERAALIILGLPFFAFYFAGWKSLLPLQRLFSMLGTCVVVCWMFFSQDFMDLVVSSSTRMEVRRDYAASVISIDGTNGLKHLLVNNIGMTALTPITKFMVDLPLSMHKGDSQSALIICFGMGTSYRTALTWGLDTTAVELIPDVPKAFGFYYPDAPDVLRDPHGRIVIDDGRRFLKRTHEKYDLIVVDPPPPVEAAGSSLLYSKEMCELFKQHLKPHGIAQIWFPGGEPLIGQAVLRSAYETFPYVRCFISVSGWGVHILASEDPIQMGTAAQLASRLPPAVQKNLVEWWPKVNVTNYMGVVLSREITVTNLLNPNPAIEITDDRPFNEYFLLRRNNLFHPETFYRP